MKIPIKSAVLAGCSVFFLHAAAAKELTDADREALLENLAKLKTTYESTSDGKSGSAAAVFRSAMGSEEGAIALYLKCVEKVEFTEQKRKASDFRDWKQSEGPRLSSPGFSLALRHQLRWLCITLQAATSKVDRAKIAADAQDAVDSLCEDLKRSPKLANHQNILNMPVTDSVFARAYELGRQAVPNWQQAPTTQAPQTRQAQLNAPTWPQTPMDLHNVYGQIILPPYRKPAGLTLLKSGWTKYIQQVVSKEAGDRGAHEVNKSAAAAAEEAADQQKLISRLVPSLQWQMEVDLFRSGDPDGALVRMMAHLEKHTTHPSWPDWYQQYKNLLKPAAATPQSKVSPPPAPETTDEDSP
jgi:hypothetical protein